MFRLGYHKDEEEDEDEEKARESQIYLTTLAQDNTTNYKCIMQYSFNVTYLIKPLVY